MTNKISDIFSEAAGQYNVRQIGDGEITRLRFADRYRDLTVFTRFCEYIDREMLFKAEQELRESYGFRSVLLKPRFPKKCFNRSVLNDMVMALKRQISTVNGSFAGCRWQYEAGTGTVNCELAHDAVSLLEEKHFSDAFARQVREEFGQEIRLHMTVNEKATRAVLPVPPPSPAPAVTPAAAPVPASASEGGTPPWEAKPAAPPPPPPPPVPDRPELTGEARAKKVKVQPGPASQTFEGIPDRYHDPEVILGTAKSLPAAAGGVARRTFISS